MYEVQDTLRIQLGRLPARDIQIVLANVHVTAPSFFVHFFLNLPRHRERDASDKDPWWISTQTMYGSGPRITELPDSSRLTWIIDVNEASVSKLGVGNSGKDILTLKEEDVLVLKVVGIGSDGEKGPLLKFDSVYVT